MSASSPTSNATLPLADQMRNDELCDRFEAAWRARQRPDLEVRLGHTHRAGQERDGLPVGLGLARGRQHGSRELNRELAERAIQIQMLH